MRCYLAGLSGFYCFGSPFPEDLIFFYVLLDFLGLGMLRFVEKEVEAKFQERNYSVLRVWGKLVLFFPTWDTTL